MTYGRAYQRMLALVGVNGLLFKNNGVSKSVSKVVKK